MRPASGFPNEQEVKEAFDAILDGKPNNLLTVIYPSPEAFFEKKNPDGSGGTLLHSAIARNDFPCMSVLFRKRFTVDGIDDEGRNLLHVATTPSAAMLVLQHAKSNALAMVAEQDFQGNLPHHRMAQNGHTQALTYLLRVASNTPALLMRPNAKGDTVLHELARHAPELIPSVISISMDVRVKNYSGQTAHDLCENKKSKTFLGAHMVLRDQAEASARETLVRQAAAAEILKAAAKAKAFVSGDSVATFEMRP